MPLFNWEGPSYCGDAPETVCDPLEAEDSVKAIHGTSKNGGCPVDLISPDHPALMVALSDIDSELRSGTAERPIPIDLVQRSKMMSVPGLAFRTVNGQLAIWQPDADCLKKRVVFDGGDFKLIDDINSNVFDQSCVGAYSDAEFICGARSFIDCTGQEKMKLIFFPVAELPTYS